MRSPRTDEPAATRTGWTIDVRSTVQFAIASVFAVALLALLHRYSQAVRWAHVQGNIQDTRIVVDRALEQKWGAELTWRADYKVAYFAAGHEYTVWSDSGIRGESEADVRLAMPQSNPSCAVQYNTKRPDESVANCR